MSSDQTGSKVNHKDEERMAQTLLPADRWVVTSNRDVIWTPTPKKSPCNRFFPPPLSSARSSPPQGIHSMALAAKASRSPSEESQRR